MSRFLETRRRKGPRVIVATPMLLILWIYVF